MKNKVWLLTKIQLLSYFGINKLRHSPKAERRRAAGRVFLQLFLLVYFFAIIAFYCAGLSSSAEALGIDMLIVPATMFSATTMLVLVMSLYASANVLFAFKDYDLVMSLPVSPGQVTLSRMLVLYSTDLLYTFVLMVPAGVVYAMKTAPGAGFYAAFIVSFFFIPLVPTVVSSVIGAGIAFISGRISRGKKLISTLLTFAFVILVMYFSMTMNSSEQLIGASLTVAETTGHIYPLTGIYLEALTPRLLPLIAFAGISLVLFGGFCLLLARFYRQINSGLTATRSRSNFKLGEQRARSPVAALYRRDLKRYFSSTVYVVNTLMGALLALVACVALAAFGVDRINSILGEGADARALISQLTPLAPIILSMLLGMNCTTGSSISIEGRQLWILRSAPVPHSSIFMSKILLNLTLTLPASLVCSTLIALTLKPEGGMLVLLYVIPIVFCVFSALLGLVTNLNIPKLDWTNETQVVKQSASAMISMFGSLLLAMIPLFLIPYLQTFDMVILLSAFVLLYAVLALALGIYLQRRGGKLFAALQDK